MSKIPEISTTFWSRLYLWGSVLLWYFWCMTLPLVGKAGVQTAHARANLMSVAGILSLSLLFSLAAGWKMKERGNTSSRQTWGWRLWTVFLIILLILLLAGAFGA